MGSSVYIDKTAGSKEPTGGGTDFQTYEHPCSHEPSHLLGSKGVIIEAVITSGWFSSQGVAVGSPRRAWPLVAHESEQVSMLTMSSAPLALFRESPAGALAPDAMAILHIPPTLWLGLGSGLGLVRALRYTY